MLATASLVFASAFPAGAQQKPQEPSKEYVQELIAKASQQTVPTPNSPASQAARGATGPTVNLTEEEAVKRAAEYNLTLISERITPQTWDYSMAATRAFYLPNLTSQVQNVNDTTLNTNVFAGGNRTTGETASWSAGLTQNMWKWGGS